MPQRYRHRVLRVYRDADGTCSRGSSVANPGFVRNCGERVPAHDVAALHLCVQLRARQGMAFASRCERDAAGLP